MIPVDKFIARNQAAFERHRRILIDPYSPQPTEEELEEANDEAGGLDVPGPQGWFR